MSILPIFASSFFAFPLIAITLLQTPPNLHPLQWRKRVLVALATTENDPQLQHQLRLLEGKKEGLDDRDLRLFAVVGTSEAIQSFRSTLHCPRNGFAVVLIGKDGGTKLNRTHPITAEELFDSIDRMPMRREELRRHR